MVDKPTGVVFIISMGIETFSISCPKILSALECFADIGVSRVGSITYALCLSGRNFELAIKRLTGCRKPARTSHKLLILGTLERIVSFPRCQPWRPQAGVPASQLLSRQTRCRLVRRKRSHLPPPWVPYSIKMGPICARKLPDGTPQNPRCQTT
jgi:hypothetical protein